MLVLLFVLSGDFIQCSQWFFHLWNILLLQQIDIMLWIIGSRCPFPFFFTNSYQSILYIDCNPWIYWDFLMFFLIKCPLWIGHRVKYFDSLDCQQSSYGAAFIKVFLESKTALTFSNQPQITDSLKKFTGFSQAET